MPLPPDVEGLPPISGSKVCTGKCRAELPASAMHFDRDRSQPDGFKSVCKMCRAEQAQENENREIAERVDKLDSQSAKLLEMVTQPGAKVPHLNELFERVMEVYGGAAGFAKHYLANYLMAPPGSAVRQKHLDAVIRMGVQVTTSGGARKPLDIMSDEELEKLANEQAKRLLLFDPDKQIDGEAKKVS